MRKLLYITNQICGSGGLERVLSIKASYFVEKLNYEVHIVTLNQKNKPLFYNFNSKIQYHDCEVTGNPLQYFKQYRKGINKVIKKITPDIISVCDDGIKGLFLPMIIDKICPMVYERHASKNLFKNSNQDSIVQKLKFYLINKLVHFGAKSYDRFVVLTQDNLTEWSLKSLKVIPNPLSFFPEKTTDCTNKMVITVANHGYHKGIDRLVRIWKTVSEKHTDWKLVVYGQKDSELKHVKLAQQLGVEKTIDFFDPVRDIEAKYLSSSIYAMPSRSEGFGMVLIEAMACSIPCVSFNCPCGPKDIISNGEDGFLVPDGDIAAFASKLSFLISNIETRIKMGKNARIKANYYLPENIVPLWDQLFTSLIQ